LFLLFSDNLAVVLNILALQDKPNIRPLSENKENCCKAEQKSVSKAEKLSIGQ
jgi:hypothetical protein